jgi:uncharacterized damage-inducible protein DinB
MALSEPLDILLEHDRWATGILLQACEGLTAEQFSRKFQIGFESLQLTLGHIIWVVMTWTDTLEGRAPAARSEEKEGGYSPAELLAMHERASDAFAAAVRKFPLDGIVKRVRNGREMRFTRGAVLTHVATHGTHHRAQCVNMLRQLGVSRLPTVNVADWSRDVDFPWDGG